MEFLGIFFALTTLASWAISDLLIKLCLSRESKWKVLLISQMCSALFVLAVALAMGELSEIPQEWIIWVLILSAMNFAGVITYYKAMSQKELSLVSPIGNTWAIVTIALGIIFYGEFISPFQWTAIFLVMGGIFAISLKKGAMLGLDGALGYAALSAIIWGVFFFMLKAPGELLGAVMIILAVRIVTAGLSIPILLGKKIRLMDTKLALVLLIAFMAAFDTLGFVTYILALDYAPISVVAPIASAVPALAVLLGIFVLKEKPNRMQIVGIVSAIAGIILLSI
jgi:drug/metabolite transporter (DMT)-like permease